MPSMIVEPQKSVDPHYVTRGKLEMSGDYVIGNNIDTLESFLCWMALKFIHNTCQIESLQAKESFKVKKTIII